MNKLALWRGKRKLTIQELANSSGVNRATITRIEKGHVKPSVKTLGQLAAALKIELEELSELTESETVYHPEEEELAALLERIAINEGKPGISHEEALAEFDRFYHNLQQKRQKRLRLVPDA